MDPPAARAGVVRRDATRPKARAGLCMGRDCILLVRMFAAGDTLGPYSILKRLGAGAMGEVYQARHRHMGRDAAIKVLRAELTEDAEVVNRFFTEARATATVRHPGIVEIFDCDLHRSGR